MFFSSVGFEKKEVKISVVEKERKQLTVKLNPTTELSEVIVVSNPLSKVKNSAFNATAINTHELINTTKTLSEALSKAPGMKIRESGGVGSDMAVTMDGFSGKHVKVFIDGVPQEGVGNSFSLNNIPVSFAERIEVYRGVVPVGFGAPWRRRKDNVLTVTYDNQYTHRFCYYTANIGYNNSDYMVPDQFAHNLTFTYALRNGRYNLSFECRNFTNANLYDNFSLQKAGRAFYGKVRIYFGN